MSLATRWFAPGLRGYYGVFISRIGDRRVPVPSKPEVVTVGLPLVGRVGVLGAYAPPGGTIPFAVLQCRRVPLSFAVRV